MVKKRRGGLWLYELDGVTYWFDSKRSLLIAVDGTAEMKPSVFDKAMGGGVIFRERA